MAGNIKSGVKIFNVTGSLDQLASASIKYTDLLTTTSYLNSGYNIYFKNSDPVTLTASYPISVSGKIIALYIRYGGTLYTYDKWYGSGWTSPYTGYKAGLYQINHVDLVTSAAQTVNGVSISTAASFGTTYYVGFCIGGYGGGNMAMNANMTFNGSTLSFTFTSVEDLTSGNRYDYEFCNNYISFRTFIDRIRVVHIG